MSDWVPSLSGGSSGIAMGGTKMVQQGSVLLQHYSAHGCCRDFIHSSLSDTWLNMAEKMAVVKTQV